MENTKKKLITYSLLLSFLILGCTSKDNSKTEKKTYLGKNSFKEQFQDTSIICKNDPSLYKEIVKNLLYTDSISNIYLKRKQQNMISPLGGELTKCEKLPYSYIDYVGTLNDSIAFIKDIIKIDSFKRIENSNTYFTDHKYVYAYRDYPVCYPAFYQININPKYNKVIDSFYIKDKLAVYWKGIKVGNADSKSFKSTVFKSKKGEKINLAYDKNYIYFYDKPYSIDRFENLPLEKNILDSLRNIYFK